MPEIGKLEDFPALAMWYHKRQQRIGNPPPETFILTLCKALAIGGSTACRIWLDGFRAFLDTSDDVLRDFLTAEEIVRECDGDLLDLFTEFGAMAVADGKSADFFQMTQAAADATGLVALRFLAAWTALNSGQLKSCVAECEKVDEPFAAMFTIQGQALLELGHAREALEALEIATRLAPSEILGWFQQAKALHALGKDQLAFAALEACRRLAPQSGEVALFMALLAGAGSTTSSQAETAWGALYPHLNEHGATPTVVFALLNIASRMRNKAWAKLVVSGANWPAARQSPDLLRELSVCLRQLQSLQWMDVAADLLTCIEPDKSQAS